MEKKISNSLYEIAYCPFDFFSSWFCGKISSWNQQVTYINAALLKTGDNSCYINPLTVAVTKCYNNVDRIKFFASRMCGFSILDKHNQTAIPVAILSSNFVAVKSILQASAKNLGKETKQFCLKRQDSGFKLNAAFYQLKTTVSLLKERIEFFQISEKNIDPGVKAILKIIPEYIDYVGEL